MFWDAVLAGLKILTFWETYVAGLEYLVIYIVPMLLLGDMLGTRGAGLRYLGMLLIPVTQVAALLVFTLTLATIIFGFSSEAAWGFPWNVMVMAPAAFFIFVAVLVVVSFVLSLVPFVGRLHSLQTLVLGGMALVFALSMIDAVDPDDARLQVDFIPDLWFSAGLIVMGGFMSWIGTAVSAQLVGAIKFSDEHIGQYIMIPVSAIFGFIPLLIYGAWLGAQVKGGF